LAPTETATKRLKKCARDSASKQFFFFFFEWKRRDFGRILEKVAQERAEKVRERLFGERSWDEALFLRWNRGEGGARRSREAEPGDGLDVFDKRAEEKNEIRERTVLYGRMGIGLLWDLLREMVDLSGRGGLWVLDEVRWESNRGGQIWEKGMQVVC
jgi:hypothetical protein